MTKKKVDKRKLLAFIVILAIGILIFTLNKPKEEIDIAENNQIEEIEDKDIGKEEKEEVEDIMDKVIKRHEMEAKKAKEKEVPAPEVEITKDEEGNKITVTKVPEINPKSVPAEVEKPKETPKPKEPPKPKNEEAKKDPTTPPKYEEKDVKPNKPATEDNSNETYNPFTDPNRPPTKIDSFNADDLPEDKRPGNGDKF